LHKNKSIDLEDLDNIIENTPTSPHNPKAEPKQGILRSDKSETSDDGNSPQLPKKKAN